jgi:hypothetical protein
VRALSFEQNTARQIAWERARDEPNAQDYVDAKAMVARVQAERVGLGLCFIPDVDDLVSRN